MLDIGAGRDYAMYVRSATVRAGRIGGNAARLWSRTGHEVVICFSRHPAGFAAVDLGSTAVAAVMEAPRRPGSVYGEEYRLPEARAVAEAVEHGQEIPPTTDYYSRERETRQ
jgi:hypothetical protein